MRTHNVAHVVVLICPICRQHIECDADRCIALAHADTNAHVCPMGGQPITGPERGWNE